jgi:hypothetical protein
MQMQAYFQLRGITPQQFEVDALLELHNIKNTEAAS